MEDLKEFIFENKPTESCHASTVLPLDDGRVVAAWFAGTKESADDVDILTSVRSESGWSEPVRVSADRNIPHWNPVLFRRADGKIMLFFKVGKKIPMWKTYFSLSDNGVDWSEPAELVPGDISGGRGPVKNKPIRLRSGRVIAPASDERNTLWVCFVDISDDDCRTWKRMRTVPTKSLRGFYVPMIQPTLWQSEDGNVHMLTRTSRGRIYRSDSSDEGETWCRAYRTKMPNNNSGIDLVLAGNGKIYLVCNPVKKNWGGRSPLDLLVSEDGGETFNLLMRLEDREGGEFSYPAITERDGVLHITYTYDREYIAYRQKKDIIKPRSFYQKLRGLYFCLILLSGSCLSFARAGGDALFRAWSARYRRACRPRGACRDSRQQRTERGSSCAG